MGDNLTMNRILTIYIRRAEKLLSPASTYIQKERDGLCIKIPNPLNVCKTQYTIRKNLKHFIRF